MLGNGLRFYKNKKNNSSRVALQYSQKKNEIINDLAVDKNEAIWVASSFSGPHKLSPKKGNIFLQENYFEGQSISSVYIDNDDEIWIGNQDGIQNQEFNERASFINSDGTMYFGGIGGFNIFNPENLKNIDVSKLLYFSELKVKDEVINTYNLSST